MKARAFWPCWKDASNRLGIVSVSISRASELSIVSGRGVCGRMVAAIGRSSSGLRSPGR